MASFVYNRGAAVLGDSAQAQATSWTGNTIKVALVKSTGYATTAARLDNTFSQITDEVTVSGYTAGGATLGSKTVTEVDGATNQVQYDAADVTFSALAAGQTIGAAVVYKDTGTGSTSPLLAFVDLTDTPTNGGDIVLTWSSSGIITLST